jgi:ribosomal protein S18 acetylase RimI-like enzyme
MAIAITSLIRDQEKEATALLARAFVTNPLHIAVFGTDRIGANEAFFRIGLAVMKGEKLVALDGLRMLGVVHWVDSEKCQVSWGEKVGLLPAMVMRIGLRSAIRVGGWLSVWSKHDPAERHVHLGPIGVSPEAQGRGVGRQLMERYCGHLDDLRVVGYLETDRPGNVTFYTKFGFQVTGTALIQGVPTYFMRRRAKSTGAG